MLLRKETRMSKYGDFTSDSLSQQYFDDVYAAKADPWNFETSSYEAGKYAASLAALPRPTYPTALELGCSIGVFTHLLAQRCKALLALDVAQRALDVARARCADQPHVRFEQRSLPDQFPAGSYDLVTVCEVGYYWSPQDLERACRITAEHQPEGADLLLVHWTPTVPDYPQTGDAVHETWLKQPWWNSLVSQRHSSYRLDVLRRSAVAAL